MHDYQRDFIELTLQREVLRFGEFTLKSGRQSPYFFNMGRIDSGAALGRLGRAYAAAVSFREWPGAGHEAGASADRQGAIAVLRERFGLDGADA